ncbi:DUF2461 domain-containing protein [Pedococcus sp. 5OH_020]|uniref:DUF2461 domain-containing protein n=1 Tax=Pedococcus sp. 5OH_020 TaxID=2989814 RepID=UPI0022E99EBF|nr:DUF2461 domain-containing protein [Pedococcus sp. 5OH_020]
MAGDAGFRGFPLWGVRFYDELRTTNTKELWSQHKAEWERAVRDPMRALVESLEDEFGPATVFRPNRDIRFSPDKSPYKTYQGAIAGPAAGIGYYVQLDADGLLVGGGFHTHSAEQTGRFRAAIAAGPTGAQLERITGSLVDQGYSLEGAALKTRPKGVEADHPRLELLRRKELMALRRLGTPAWLESKEALDRVRAEWSVLRPLVDWVSEHVGPAADGPRPGRR